LGSNAYDVRMQQVLVLLKSFFCFSIIFTIFIGTIVGGTRNIEESNPFPRSYISIRNGQFVAELGKMGLAIFKNVSIGGLTPKEKVQFPLFDSCYHVWANDKWPGRGYCFGSKQDSSVIIGP
jgi:hypothetical protein